MNMMNICIVNQTNAKEQAETDRQNKLNAIHTRIQTRVLQELNTKENWTEFGCLVTYDYNKEEDELNNLFKIVKDVCETISSQNSKYYLEVEADFHNLGNSDKINTFKKMFNNRMLEMSPMSPMGIKPPARVRVVVIVKERIVEEEKEDKPLTMKEKHKLAKAKYILDQEFSPKYRSPSNTYIVGLWPRYSQYDLLEQGVNIDNYDKSSTLNVGAKARIVASDLVMSKCLHMFQRLNSIESIGGLEWFHS